MRVELEMKEKNIMEVQSFRFVMITNCKTYAQIGDKRHIILTE